MSFKDVKSTIAQLLSGDLINKAVTVFMASMFLSLACYIAVFVYRMAHDEYLKTTPPTLSDVEAAQRRVELKKLEAAELTAWSAEFDRAEVAKQLEQLKLDAERQRLGIPVDVTKSNSGTQALAAFGDVLYKNVLLIVGLTLLALVFNSFSASKEPWRLILQIALLLVVFGGVSLVYGVTSNTKVELKLSSLFATMNSGSVGLFLMAFGTLLAGYSLHFPKSREQQRDDA